MGTLRIYFITLLIQFEFNVILYRSIALWTLFQKSFGFNSIKWIVRPQSLFKVESFFVKLSLIRVICFDKWNHPLISIEFYQVAHQSIALWTFYQKSFESISIRPSVVPQTSRKRRRPQMARALPLLVFVNYRPNGSSNQNALNT